jgi:N utilization substance protein B
MSARRSSKRALDFFMRLILKIVQLMNCLRVVAQLSCLGEPYVGEVISGVTEHIGKIDELIMTYAQGWIWIACRRLIGIFCASRY